MRMFIRMLPPSVTSGELNRFIHKGAEGFWSRLFSSQGRINCMLIIRVTNQSTHSVEYHGLVDYKSATSAQAAIKSLNRTILKGVPVEVRIFHHRAELRDRRTWQSDREHELFNDLRKRDRRRSRLAVEPVPVSGVFKVGDSIPVTA